MRSTCIAGIWRGENALISEILDHNNRHLWTLPITYLNGNEANGLREGRFTLFSREDQKYHVTLNVNDVMKDVKLERASEMIEWIAEQGRGVWSLEFEMEHMSRGECIFSFENSTTAVVFALVFA